MILSILWGGSFFFVEIAVQGLPVLTVVWCRVALAAGILAIVIRAMGAAFPARADWPALAVMGLLNNLLPFTLFVLALGQITGSLAAILNATTPLFTVIVAHLATQDERVTPAKIFGLLIGFAGVVLMMGTAGHSGEVWAKLACLLAACSYGFASIWGRRFRARGLAPLSTAFGQVAASAVMLFPVWVLVDQPWALAAPSGQVMAAVVGLAGLSTALAYLLFFRILASAGATQISLVTFLVPVSATALGALILGERLGLLQIAGFLLILTGLLAINRRGQR